VAIARNVQGALLEVLCNAKHLSFFRRSQFRCSETKWWPMFPRWRKNFPPTFLRKLCVSGVVSCKT